MAGNGWAFKSTGETDVGIEEQMRSMNRRRIIQLTASFYGS